MKKKIYLLLLTLAAVAQNISAQNIAINATNFPNANFRAWLMDSNNINGAGVDGVLTPEEIAGIKEISVTSKSIPDLTGIEHFTALEELRCFYNKITALDVSQNANLKKLECSSNKLTSLNIRNNTNLEYLDCSNNQIEGTLDLRMPNNRPNTNLKYVDCSYNKISALFGYRHENLEVLHCQYNQLTNVWVLECVNLVDLDCSNNTANSTFWEMITENCPKLEFLKCENFGITTLDVSKNLKLQYLDCDKNGLTTLDVSKNSELRHLECAQNDLGVVDVTHNPKLTFLDCYETGISVLDISQNPKLEHIDCRVNDLSSIDVTIHTQLSELLCNQNKITELDLSNNPQLGWLWCGRNELTSLDLRNNPKLYNFGCENNHLMTLDLSHCYRLYKSNTDYQYKDVDLVPLDDEHVKIGIEITPQYAGQTLDPSTYSNLRIERRVAHTVVAENKDFKMEVHNGKPYIVIAEYDENTTTEDLNYYHCSTTCRQAIPLHPDVVNKTYIFEGLPVNLTTYPYVMHMNKKSFSERGRYYSGTIILDYDAVVPNDAEAYIITGLALTQHQMVKDGEKYSFEQLVMKRIGVAGDVIPANTPIYVKSLTKDGLYIFGRNLEGKTPVAVPAGNLLMGSTSDSSGTNGAYSVLTLGREHKTGEVGFWQYNKADRIPMHRCYLPASILNGASAGAKGAVFLFDDEFGGEVTGIEDVTSTHESNNGWYTLDGKKLNGKPTEKGIYIHNNKKEVVQ